MRTAPLIAAAALALAAAGCGAEAGGRTFHCSYESRYSACGGGSYSSWTPYCIAFNEDDLTVSPATYCQNFTGSGHLSCAAGCCVYTDYQGSTLGSGPCP